MLGNSWFYCVRKLVWLGILYPCNLEHNLNLWGLNCDGLILDFWQKPSVVCVHRFFSSFFKRHLWPVFREYTLIGTLICNQWPLGRGRTKVEQSGRNTSNAINTVQLGLLIKTFNFVTEYVKQTCYYNNVSGLMLYALYSLNFPGLSLDLGHLLFWGWQNHED